MFYFNLPGMIIILIFGIINMMPIPTQTAFIHPKVLRLREKLNFDASPKLKARDWVQPSSGIFRTGGFSSYVRDIEIIERFKSL